MKQLLIKQTIKKELQKIANPEIAKHSQRYFKTGKGEYGAGDIFLGIRMPVLRKITLKNKEIDLKDILYFLCSKYHEERLLALLFLIQKFQTAEKIQQKTIFEVYLKYAHYINNWDLVDVSAHHIVGGYLVDKEREILYDLVQSPILWKRRIAMMSTYHFIKKGDFVDCLKLAELLLQDKEDLIHKVSGWMLREVAKKDKKQTLCFLDKYYRKMPRVMLRYSIEKFSAEARKSYLQK